MPHESVEALTMLVAVEQQLPNFSLQLTDHCNWLAMPAMNLIKALHLCAAESFGGNMHANVKDSCA